MIQDKKYYYLKYLQFLNARIESNLVDENISI